MIPYTLEILNIGFLGITDMLDKLKTQTRDLYVFDMWKTGFS